MVLIIFVGFSAWLWTWKPPAPNTQFYKMVKMTLPQAIHNTTVIHTYSNLNNFGIQFVKPMNAARLSSDAMIGIIYKTLDGYWYSGTVKMYYAKVVGGPGNGQLSWIVENHMLFGHSYPVHDSPSIWDRNAWASKYQSLYYALHFKTKQLTAITIIFYDATTGKYFGAIRSESH
jgi:hypothetical protein